MSKKDGKVLNFAKSFLSTNKLLVRRIIALLIVIIAILVIASCFKGNKFGNSFSNSYNNGLATKSGKWIYFVKYMDGESEGIYKIKDKGNNAKQVIKGDYKYLNVLGNKLYCLEEDDSKINLVKMKTNGKKKEVLIRNISDEPINVVGKWVYYFKEGKLYRTKTNGNKNEAVSDKNISYYQVDGKWIYYIYTSKNNYYVAKMKLDGDDSTVIYKSEDKISALYIKGNKIYYVISKLNKSNDYETFLYKVNKKNGEKEEKVCKIDSSILYDINMQKDKIYYTTVTDDYSSYEIKSIKYDGNDKEVIKNLKGGYSLNVVGKWFVYGEGSNSYKMDTKIVSIDGKKEKNL